MIIHTYFEEHNPINYKILDYLEKNITPNENHLDFKIAYMDYMNSYLVNYPFTKDKEFNKIYSSISIVLMNFKCYVNFITTKIPASVYLPLRDFLITSSQKYNFNLIINSDHSLQIKNVPELISITNCMGRYIISSNNSNDKLKYINDIKCIVGDELYK